MARPEKVRLGEILVQQKRLSEEQLQFSLNEQKRTGRKRGRVLVENGLVTEEQISTAIARQLDLPFIHLKFFNVHSDTVRLLPEMQARRFRALVLEDRSKSLPPVTPHRRGASRWQEKP
jgi:MSHA biogenesis protein MshE